MNQKKLLIVSASAGAGHVRAAEALVAASEKSHPDLQVVHLDLMEEVRPFFRKVYSSGYLKIVDRYPRVWRSIYNMTNRPAGRRFVPRIRIAVENFCSGKLPKIVRKLSPDAVCCTHFLPAQILSRMKKKKVYSGVHWVQITDFDAHYSWVHKHVDGYNTAAQEITELLTERGVKPQLVHAAGIPIMPVFSETQDIGACRKKLGLAIDDTAVLLMSGGYGIGGVARWAKQILEVAPGLKVIAVAGRNRKQKFQLEELRNDYPDRLIPFGFTDTIQELMAACDFTVTKPGGLTTSESLAMKLPMIVNRPIAGQEEKNASFLKKHGAAVIVRNSTDLSESVKRLSNSPDELKRLKTAAAKIAKPEAADHLLDLITESLKKRE